MHGLSCQMTYDMGDMKKYSYSQFTNINSVTNEKWIQNIMKSMNITSCLYFYSYELCLANDSDFRY